MDDPTTQTHGDTPCTPEIARIEAKLDEILSFINDFKTAMEQLQREGPMALMKPGGLKFG